MTMVSLRWNLTSLGEMWALESDQWELMGDTENGANTSLCYKHSWYFSKILCDGSFGLLVLLGGIFELWVFWKDCFKSKMQHLLFLFLPHLLPSSSCPHLFLSSSSSCSPPLLYVYSQAPGICSHHYPHHEVWVQPRNGIDSELCSLDFKHLKQGSKCFLHINLASSNISYMHTKLTNTKSHF